MQINGFSSNPSLPVDRTTTPQRSAGTTSEPADQAVISSSGDSFSSLVNEASQMPEVRTDLVDSFKARIASGEYPTQDATAGLANAIGGDIVRQAQLAS